MNANTNTPKTDYPLNIDMLARLGCGGWDVEWTFSTAGLERTIRAAIEDDRLRRAILATPQTEATSTEAGNAVAWIPPEREGEYHSSDFINASRTEKAGWEPLFRARRAAQAPTAVQASAMGESRELAWTDDDGTHHSMSVESATKTLAELFKAWPAGLDEIEASVGGWRGRAQNLEEKIAALATAAVQGDASSVPAPVVTVAGQVGEAWLQDAHSDNAPLGFNSHERGSWSIGYETGYRAALAAASSVQQKDYLALFGVEDLLRGLGYPDSADAIMRVAAFVRERAPAAPGPAASRAVPLTEEQITQGWVDWPNSIKERDVFRDGVRFAEHMLGAAASPALAPEQSHD